jgi:transcriptional repressor NrdR
VGCPQCDSPKTSILETRRADNGDAVRRRRRCSLCGHRFTTYERREPLTLAVVKRDGRRQPFNREKLLAGLVRASHKRDVDPRRLEEIANRIERTTRDEGGELSAERVGELCLEGLADLDRGAYLQFAGTLPDSSGNPRKHGTTEVASSVRGTEDAAVLTPETEREEKN